MCEKLNVMTLPSRSLNCYKVYALYPVIQ